MNEREPDNQCEIQPLKWVLSTKRYPNSQLPVWYRTRFVIASNQTDLRHSVYGNAPTVAMYAIRIEISLFPTWSKEAAQNGSKLVFFTRDITKAFLKSIPRKRLIYYEPPQEYFGVSPGSRNVIWKTNTQLYGGVKAGIYWNKPLFPGSAITPWTFSNPFMILPYFLAHPIPH